MQLYVDAGLTPPKEGKGIHTYRFHECAVSYMKKGMDKNEAYKRCMGALGELAINPEHRRTEMEMGKPGIFKKEIIKIGRWVNGLTGDFVNITKEMLKNWYDNFKSGIYKGVNIPLRHANAYNPKENAGWITDLELAGDGSSLIATHTITEPDIADKIRHGTIKDVSIGNNPEYKHPSKGKIFDVLDHVCLTLKPMLQGLAPFVEMEENYKKMGLILLEYAPEDINDTLNKFEEIELEIFENQNKLPDSSFLWLSPEYKAGETKDKAKGRKLPIKDKNGNIIERAVVAAMAAILGARGGVDIPESDRKAIYNKLVKLYKKFGREAPAYHESDIFNSNLEDKENMSDELNKEIQDKTDEIKKLNEKLTKLEADQEKRMAFENQLVEKDSELKKLKDDYQKLQDEKIQLEADREKERINLLFEDIEKLVTDGKLKPALKDKIKAIVNKTSGVVQFEENGETIHCGKATVDFLKEALTVAIKTDQDGKTISNKPGTKNPGDALTFEQYNEYYKKGKISQMIKEGVIEAKGNHYYWK